MRIIWRKQLSFSWWSTDRIGKKRSHTYLISSNTYPICLWRKCYRARKILIEKKYIKSINMKISRMRISIQCYRLYIHILLTQRSHFSILSIIYSQELVWKCCCSNSLWNPSWHQLKTYCSKTIYATDGKFCWKMSANSFNYPNGTTTLMWTKNAFSHRIAIAEIIHTYIHTIIRSH